MHSKENHQGTIGEEAVNTLAFNTYLRYWCYPGPKDEKNFNKEICDLLILFRDTMIIISVKNYSFKGNYSRYFRSTLDKAVSQVSGAERRLMDHNRELLISHTDLGICKFEPASIKKIHRIIVNHNEAPLFYPAGKQTPISEFVHIFNWAAFHGLVMEMDTIPDFVNYLDEREQILNKKSVILMNGTENEWNPEVQKSFAEFSENNFRSDGNFILISGTELDLVADYLWNNKKFNEHFYDSKVNGMSFELDGKWFDYLARKEVKNKKSADTVSYFIDEFLKKEVLYKTDPTNLELAVELLSLSRFERRVLGKEFFSMLSKYGDSGERFIGRRYGKVGDLVIAYILYSRDLPLHIVIQLCQIAAEGYAIWNKYMDKKIVIIGFSQDGVGFRFGFLRVKPFTKEQEEQVVEDLKTLNWFTEIEMFTVNHEEYPS